MLESSNKFNPNTHLNHVMTPDAPTTSGGTPPEAPTPETPEKKKRMSLRNKLLLGGAGVALAAVAGAGIGLSAANSEHGPQKSPTESSAPATPNTEPSKGAETTPATPELTVESLQLDPNATPQEWATQYNKGLGEWRMAGANADTYNRNIDGSVHGIQFATQEAQKYAAIYAEAYYGPNWESNDDLKYAVDKFEIPQNASALVVYMATFKEKTPYKWSENTDSVTVLSTSADGSETTVEIVSTATNNSASNRAGELKPELLTLNNTQTTEDVTFVKSDGHVYVKDFHAK